MFYRYMRKRVLAFCSCTTNVNENTSMKQEETVHISAKACGSKVFDLDFVSS